jgi:hypothetical protein
VKLDFIGASRFNSDAFQSKVSGLLVLFVQLDHGPTSEMLCLLWVTS